MGDTARHLVENHLYFDVLSHAGVGLSPECRTPGIPSWVPDWANPPLYTPLHVLRLKGMKLVRYYASVSSLLRYGRKPNNDIQSRDGFRDTAAAHQLREIASDPENSLLLRGSCFDEIIALGPVLARYKANENTAGTDSDLKASRLEEIKNFDDAFWRTLIGDRTLTERPAQPIYGEYHRRWTYRMSECLFHENSPQIDSRIAEIDTRDMVAWSDALERCAMGRRLCVASKGFIGMDPPRTEICDEIAFIFGAATPFVIRHPNGRCDGSKGCNLPFLFVGECYVHGIMDGEAFSHIVPSLNSSRLSFV